MPRGRQRNAVQARKRVPPQTFIAPSPVGVDHRLLPFVQRGDVLPTENLPTAQRFPGAWSEWAEVQPPIRLALQPAAYSPQDPRSPPSLPAASPMPTPLLSSSLSSIALCTPVRASSASHGFPPLFSSWDRAAEKPAAPQTLYSHLVFSLRQSNRRVFHPTGRDHPLSGRAPFRPTSMHISSTICPFFPLFS